MLNDLEMLNKHYTNKNIQFRIVSHLYNRETMMMTTSRTDDKYKKATKRYIRIHNVSHFEFWMKRAEVLTTDKCYNLYYSLAKYKHGIPYTDPKKFTSESNDDWRANHFKEMNDYDFAIDIDASDKYEEMELAYFSFKEMVKEFDSLNVPYYPRFSGMGFHIVIPYKYFQHLGLSFEIGEGHNSIYSYYRQLSEKLSREFTEQIDKKIYDSRRVLKIPFTLALYKDNIQLCKPFYSRDEIETFKYNPDNYTVDYSKIPFNNEPLFNSVNGDVRELINKYMGVKQ